MLTLENAKKALSDAYELMDMCEDPEYPGVFLEPRSALKQAASDNGITEGSELQSFVRWAEKQMYGSDQ
jgi:hypothetical protein